MTLGDFAKANAIGEIAEIKAAAAAAAEADDNDVSKQFPNPRKTFWRSASWSASHSAPPSPGGRCRGGEKGTNANATSNSSSNRCGKSRIAFPPLQPLCVARRSLEEWPRAGSDDIGEWLTPATPKNAKNVKLDLANIQRSGIHLEPTEEQRARDKFAFFEKDCSRVAEHIYLGSDAVARNKEILDEHGITHVLNCVGFVCPEYFKKDLVYKTLWLQDSPCEDITSILYDVFDYFEEVREQGGRVLVHCYQGVSRSTSLVIGYLMWRKGQSFEDAFQYVKAARGVTNPNMGFACQLLQCQKRVHAAPLSPSSMVRMFRMAPHSPYDPLHLVPKLIAKPSHAALDSRGAFLVQVPTAIYVWIGQNCDEGMVLAAKASANQVVRYERVQDSIVTVLEGEDNADFWDVMGRLSHKSGVDMQQIGEDLRLGVGNKSVESYDMDFELYRRASVGGVVPPVPLPGTGAETRLPTRENGWGILRRKWAAGNIKGFDTVSSDMNSKANPAKKANNAQNHEGHVQCNMESSSSSPSSSSSQSSPSSVSSDSKPISPSSFTPTSVSSGSSTSWSPCSPSPLANIGEVFYENPSNTVQVCFRQVSPLSLAQRRGSASPSLQLPFIGKGSFRAHTSESNTADAIRDCQQHHTTVRTELPRLEQGGFSSKSQDRLKEKRCRHTLSVPDSQEMGNNSGEVISDLNGDLLCTQPTVSPSPGMRERCRLAQPMLYTWPKLEKIEEFDAATLDSRSVFFLTVPSRVGNPRCVEVVYEWIGCDFIVKKEGCKSKCIEKAKQKDVEWIQIGCRFLEEMELQRDTPIQMHAGIELGLVTERKQKEDEQFMTLLDLTFVYYKKLSDHHNLSGHRISNKMMISQLKSEWRIKCKLEQRDRNESLIDARTRNLGT